VLPEAIKDSDSAGQLRQRSKIWQDKFFLKKKTKKKKWVGGEQIVPLPAKQRKRSEIQ